jgi:hypothetical protein
VGKILISSTYSIIICCQTIIDRFAEILETTSNNKLTVTAFKTHILDSKRYTHQQAEQAAFSRLLTGYMPVTNLVSLIFPFYTKLIPCRMAISTAYLVTVDGWKFAAMLKLWITLLTPTNASSCETRLAI